MWCYLASGDYGEAVKQASGIVGERAGTLLPLVLAPGIVSKSKRRELLQEQGIGGLKVMWHLLTVRHLLCRISEPTFHVRLRML